MMKCLLTDAGDFMDVDFDYGQEKLVVRIDRSKISSQAKPALGRMLLRLHMYRCTADVTAVSSRALIPKGYVIAESAVMRLI